MKPIESKLETLAKYVVPSEQGIRDLVRVLGADGSKVTINGMAVFNYLCDGAQKRLQPLRSTSASC